MIAPPRPVKNIVASTLECCAAAPEAVLEEGRSSKVVVHEALAPLLPTALALLRIYVQDTGTAARARAACTAAGTRSMPC